MLRRAREKLRGLRALLRERIYVSPATRAEVIRSFHRLYYNSSRLLEQDTSRIAWMGVPTLKCPMDLFVYQELLFELRPELVIETGTYAGGSALFLAQMLELIGGPGRVLSIDVRPSDTFPRHRRLSYLTGSSISSQIVDQVRAAAEGKSTVVGFLDADHSREHVLAELRCYGGMVSVGSYLVVEDSNVNGHPVREDHGPGPMEALEAFLATDHRYESDRSRERFLLTMNPRGFLKRVR